MNKVFAQVIGGVLIFIVGFLIIGKISISQDKKKQVRECFPKFDSQLRQKIFFTCLSEIKNNPSIVHRSDSVNTVLDACGRQASSLSVVGEECE